MKTPLIQPYLFFAGNCADAILYYQHVFGAELKVKMMYQDHPDQMPEGFEDKIMHATLMLGDQALMMSDGPKGGDKSFAGFMLCVTLDDEDSLQRSFERLAKDGEITMPLNETFWTLLFGGVTDKFGVNWGLSLPAIEGMPA